MASSRHRRILAIGLLVIALVASACRSGTTSSRTADAAEGDSAVAQTSAPTAAPTAAPPTPTADRPDESELPAETEPTATPNPAPPATPAPTATPEPVPLDMDALFAESSLEPVDCPTVAAASRVTCSVATVPRDVDSPRSGETVELMVAWVDNGDPNGVGPVVFLQGGPGVGSIQNAPNFVGASHDVLFVDQRGTGFSTPKLACPEVDDLWQSQLTNDENERVAKTSPTVTNAYFDCAERLTQSGIDFDHFNTRAAATDIELLRRLFGYDQWALWGISYGTRLGLTVMRDHPQGVSAAVLDSVVPFEVDFFATIPQHGLRSIEALDAACDAERCATDHGDLYENLAALVLRLDAEPAVVEVTRPGSGTTFPFRVDGEELLNMVFTQLYSTRSLRALPRQVSRADFGGMEEMVNLYVARRDPASLDLSIGLYYSTWCREEVPFYDASLDDALVRELESDFGPAFAASLSSDGSDIFCDAFAVSPSPPVDNQPLNSDIPTLVFAGAFDPITPPAWSRQVADQLTNSTYVELANHGHGMSTSCPTSIRVAFLADPSAPVDSSCAANTGPPDFE